tara:strand:+ start:1411 stop:1680 length:270 start_codon:yes stop_codon:yes gene_type:complete
MKIKEKVVSTVTKHIEVKITDEWSCVCGGYTKYSWSYPLNMNEVFDCEHCEEANIFISPDFMHSAYSEILEEKGLILSDSGYEIERIKK